MTGEPGPPLRPLLSGALGRDAAGADPDVVLATARANALPLTPIAAELALDTSPRWAEATAAEAAQGRVRGTTVDLVVQALGPLAPGVAWCAPRWRPASGTDVDLVAPPVLLDEVSDALRAAGLVPASPWASPARRVAVRMEAGAVLDLVDVEAVDECVERGGPGLGHLGPTASARRLCRRITRSGIVRLVDVADAEVLHLRRLPDALAHDRHARAGWSALEDVRAHLASRRGGPVAMPWRVGPRRRPPRVVLTEAVHRVAVPARGPRRHHVVIQGSPYADAGPVAEGVAAGLRRAGISAWVTPSSGRSARRAAVAAWRWTGVVLHPTGGGERRPRRATRVGPLEVASDIEHRLEDAIDLSLRTVLAVYAGVTAPPRGGA